MYMVKKIDENDIQDAVEVTEEEKMAQEEKAKEELIPGGFLLVHVVKPDGTPVEGGIQFTLRKDFKLLPAQALSFIKAFSASKLPDGHTLVVTAHLANGMTMSEIYEAGPLEDYNEEEGIEFCKGKLFHRVWECLELVWSMATYTPDKEKANDELAEKLAAAVKQAEDVKQVEDVKQAEDVKQVE